jgi:hypothetical protein
MMTELVNQQSLTEFLVLFGMTQKTDDDLWSSFASLVSDQEGHDTLLALARKVLSELSKIEEGRPEATCLLLPSEFVTRTARWEAKKVYTSEWPNGNRRAGFFGKKTSPPHKRL